MWSPSAITLTIQVITGASENKVTFSEFFFVPCWYMIKNIKSWYHPGGQKNVWYRKRTAVLTPLATWAFQMKAEWASVRLSGCLFLRTFRELPMEKTPLDKPLLLANTFIRWLSGHLFGSTFFRVSEKHGSDVRFLQGKEGLNVANLLSVEISPHTQLILSWGEMKPAWDSVGVSA